MTTRRFELHRDTDVTGVSGTGVVAEGMHFVEPDICVLRWTSQTPTSVVFHEKGLASVEAVHGHGGATRIVWLDGRPRSVDLTPGTRIRVQGDVSTLLRRKDPAEHDGTTPFFPGWWVDGGGGYADFILDDPKYDWSVVGSETP